MNFWGFTVYSETGRVIFHDFGYETEAEAAEYGRKFIEEWAVGAQLVVSQRWSELDEDPNEFEDECPDEEVPKGAWG